MRTIIYIDGYNLYYSVLTKSAYKWLDVYELFANKVIKPVVPSANITAIKYFTAPILGRYAKDPDSPHRQTRYLNALKAKLGQRLQIIQGYHTEKETSAYLVGTQHAVNRLKVKVLEEKQTDVNLSLHMYRDAVRQTAGQFVMVSNDSDLVPAVEMIKCDYPEIKIGVVLPALSHHQGARKSRQLEKLADWTRDHLRIDELAQSQLPERLQNRKNKTIRKPECW